MEERIEKQPLVSIIIPVYNGSNFLRQSIDSALGQSYPNVEVIVVNDGSDDEGRTEAIALSYGHRIRYIFKPNGGVSSALNEGIRNMKGEYFSWLSHDDLYTPDKIRHQVERLPRGNPRAVVLCSCRQIDKETNFLPEIRRLKCFESDFTAHWRDALKLLWKQGYFNGCAMLIPKAVFEECGGFHEDLRFCQDLLMWIRIFLHKYSLIYVNQPDVYYRIHDAQLTQTGRALYYLDSLRIAQLLLPELCGAEKEFRELLYDFARNNAIYNNPKVVSMCIRASETEQLLTHHQMAKLHILSGYGALRPFVRRAYYQLFKNVKTR